jgi:hypothetical protein
MGNSKLLEGRFLENLNLAGQSIEKKRKKKSFKLCILISIYIYGNNNNKLYYK